ncbi:MAG: hypothetical protein JWO38_1744 [Gemmataceae bacterium]|nr:hypothetical protein [Gemmataceae bacterium]
MTRTYTTPVVPGSYRFFGRVARDGNPYRHLAAGTDGVLVTVRRAGRIEIPGEAGEFDPEWFDRWWDGPLAPASSP